MLGQMYNWNVRFAEHFPFSAQQNIYEYHYFGVQISEYLDNWLPIVIVLHGTQAKTYNEAILQAYFEAWSMHLSSTSDSGKFTKCAEGIASDLLTLTRTTTAGFG